MEKKEKIIKNDSAYEKSLKRLLKLSRNYCDELNDKIDNEKKAIKEIENSFTAGEVAIYLFSVTILIEVLGTILIGVLPQAQELLTYLDTHPKIFPLITVPTAIIIPIVSLPIASIIDSKNKKSVLSKFLY